MSKTAEQDAKAHMDMAGGYRAMRQTLVGIASLNDTQANIYLERTGSYGRFDEPGAVQAARETLAKVPEL